MVSILSIGMVAIVNVVENLDISIWIQAVLQAGLVNSVATLSGPIGYEPPTCIQPMPKMLY
jgi:hypothetical protein